MNNDGGCFIIALVMLVVWAVLIAVCGMGDAIDSREVHPKFYQEVLEMDNEYTTELIHECMSDGKITVAELNAVRKRFNETSGPQADLERRYGE